MRQAIVLVSCIACFCINASANTQVFFNKKLFNDSSNKSALNINDILQEMITLAGCETKFELKEADVLNMEASISHNKKYILYNPTFVNDLNTATRNNKWVLMTLLAHEIGHHLNGDTKRKKKSTPEMELKADEFAGYVMYKLGATLLQSQNVMFYIARIEQSKTHPGRSSRLEAIEKGWKQASEMAEQAAIVTP